jgi:hypothetical protein
MHQHRAFGNPVKAFGKRYRAFCMDPNGQKKTRRSKAGRGSQQPHALAAFVKRPQAVCSNRR